MPGESPAKKKIVVVGAGVSGLGAAWHLAASKDVEVTVLEAGQRPGGHANTVEVEVDGKAVPVDTGFMVYNRLNYPNMIRLFEELGVEEQDTDMSFSVSLDGGTLEWGSLGLGALLAQPGNAFSPSFHKMLRDMARFNREAPALLTLHPDDPRKAVSLGEYLKKNGYSDVFARHYLVPMAAAIWSSASADVMAFSAVTMIGFFHNHRLLQVFGRPQWKTPAGRSIKYVQAITKVLGERLETGNACQSLEPPADAGGRWAVKDGKGAIREFDEVILACHADTAKALLGSGEGLSDQRQVLEMFPFAANDVYVHTDQSLMPRRRAAWSSWNYLGSSSAAVAAAAEGGEADTKPVFVTYWLNRLQGLDCEKDIFVSLNPTTPPDAALVLRRLSYDHPQFSAATEEAQRQLREVNGARGLWFCGAWTGYGFHEDGLRSGLEAATAITGTPVPWVPSAHAHASSSSSKTLAGPEEAAAVNGSSGNGSRNGDKAHPAVAANGVAANGHATKGTASNGHHAVANGSGEEYGGGPEVLVLPVATMPAGGASGLWALLERGLYSLWAGFCFHCIRGFLAGSITKGCLTVVCPDESVHVFGSPLGKNGGGKGVTLRVYDWAFFSRVALEFDLGVARSYMAGEWELVGDGPDPDHDRLAELFALLVENRDDPAGGGMQVTRMLTSWVGYGLNYLKYKFSLDNTLSGSRSNISAHYDLSNDLFETFLDEGRMVYSCAVFDAALKGLGSALPTELVFRDTLESAQVRKLDLLLARARVEKNHRLLDIGFGWGGLAIRAAETIGCRVHGITLSKEQKALAEQKVREKGLEHLVTFELVDYRMFAKARPGQFDRIASCEMIEAVGHKHLGSFFAAVEALLSPGGLFVMQAITMPECRYEEYLRSTDFINTIIFPGGCAPSLQALLTAMSTHSMLSLEGFENVCMHYAETLRRWRHRFNKSLHQVRQLGFDSEFIRCWNYYFAYCEAGFRTQTLGCLVLTFSRPGTRALLPAQLVTLVG